MLLPFNFSDSFADGVTIFLVRGPVRLLVIVRAVLNDLARCAGQEVLGNLVLLALA